jgi:hypothetical protein
MVLINFAAFPTQGLIVVWIYHLNRYRHAIDAEATSGELIIIIIVMKINDCTLNTRLILTKT